MGKTGLSEVVPPGPPPDDGLAGEDPLGAHIWINKVFGYGFFRRNNRITRFFNMTIREKHIAFSFVQIQSPTVVGRRWYVNDVRTDVGWAAGKVPISSEDRVWDTRIRLESDVIAQVPVVKLV